MRAGSRQRVVCDLSPHLNWHRRGSRVEIGLGGLPCGLSGGGVSDEHGVSAAWTGIHRGPDPPCPSVSGLDPKAMDRCDCDGAGEVDDSRGPSHLSVRADDLGRQQAPEQQTGAGLSPLLAVCSSLGWIFSGRISSFRLHRPNHMGGICSRNSCKSVDGSPPQRQSNGGVVDPACRGHCPCPVATQPAVAIAARCPLAPPSSCNHQRPGDPSSSEQSGACEMPGTPNLRQRSHQLATQQLPFMPGLLLRRGGRCPSMPRIMMACIEDRGRLPLPPGMAVVCRALAGGGGSCAVVAAHLLMLASRRAVPEFPSLLPPFDAAPHHARTRTASWKGPGPRLPPSTALGGQHCGLCNLWMEKRFHARARVLPLFPVPAGVPPIQFLPHLLAPPVSCFPPTLSASQWSPSPPAPNRGVATAPGGPSDPRLVRHPSSCCFPARFPAPLHHQRWPASRYPGVLRYRSTSFFPSSPSLWRRGQADAAACAVGPATSVVSTSLSCCRALGREGGGRLD